MGLRGGLSLRGGTGCPAPHWNMEHEPICKILSLANFENILIFDDYMNSDKVGIFLRYAAVEVVIWKN